MKNTEGIALILAIIFMLALSLLLTALLLLSNQEIYATQSYLDGNKAFYYAEAGVEYGVAQLLNEKSVDELNQSSGNFLKQSFGDSNISLVNLNVEDLTASRYKITCEVNYNKATRIIEKEITLYTGIWKYAMSSNGGIDLSINPGRGGTIIIDGDIASNGEIKIGSGVSINGDYYPKMTLEFPPTDYVYYKSIASYKYNSQDEFENALNLDPSDPNYPKSGIVYIEGTLHIIRDLNIPTGITIVVNGEIHVNNSETLTMDGGEKMVAFIAKDLKFNNDALVTFKNCILYTTNNADFTNMKSDVLIDNGAIYAQMGYISLNNIKDTFQVNRGDWKYKDLIYMTGGHNLFPIYTVESWADLGT